MWKTNSIQGLYRGYTNLGMKASLNFVPFFLGMDLAREYVPDEPSFSPIGDTHANT
jgi:hypothetical protein